MSAPRLSVPMAEALLLLAESQYTRLPVSQNSHWALPRWDVYVNASTAYALERRGLVALVDQGHQVVLTDAGREAAAALAGRRGRKAS
jgi:hypothetical protein